MKSLPLKPPDISDLSFINQILLRYFEDSDFKKTVDAFNDRYLYWDELTYRIQDEEERLETWTAMKVFRSQKMEKISYPLLKMEYSPIPTIQKSLHLFDRYLSGTIQIQNRSLQLDKRYIVSSLIEEAIASSILEGAVTTRKKARIMIEQKRKPRSHGEQMVLNNYNTLQMITRKKEDRLTPDLLLEIQRMVTKDTIDPEDVGHFRNSNDVRVMDVVNNVVYHIPPDWQEISRLLEQLCEFANQDDEEKFIHPIIKGIIIHFLVGYIHPFNDGNGRTARSLFYWYTLSRGYWLMEYLSISRSILKTKGKYSLAYLHTEFDQLDLTYFIRYHIDCMNKALDEMITFIEEKQDQQRKSQEIVRLDNNITPRQGEIFTEMMEAPGQLFTIYQIAERFNVVYQTARTDLMHLEDLGYVVKEKRGKGLYFIYKGK
ncbi:Fic family protein [Methanospirillum stamsii]|uniref:Fic family protein n=1 Tax=Methanospirillum stamsii TaxID=1277351 RepID=A0A2V2NDN8_9EURY|nr:Fic family protein [Methanospirillum stamsii]PWR75706.1 Fic family protein [Methanospirillum stamsii]